MSRRQQFNLKFYKAVSKLDGEIYNVCKYEGLGGQYSHLVIIQQLNKDSTKALIEEIDLVNNSQLLNQQFSTDGIDEEYIILNYPNVILGEGDLVISMIEMKELLEEWLSFIDS